MEESVRLALDVIPAGLLALLFVAYVTQLLLERRRGERGKLTRGGAFTAAGLFLTFVAYLPVGVSGSLSTWLVLAGAVLVIGGPWFRGKLGSRKRDEEREV